MAPKSSLPILLLALCAPVFGMIVPLNENDRPSFTFRMRCPEIELDPQEPMNYCSERLIEGKLKVGELCLLRPEQARPTQAAIGKVLARCITRKLERDTKHEIRQYVRALQIPTVVGPGGTFYITDNHHLAYALFEATLKFGNPMMQRVMYACIDSDYGNKTTEEFFTTLQDRNSIYLRDEKGTAVQATDVPTALKDMADDPYRTLAEWVQSSRGYIKCGGTDTEKLYQCAHSGDAPLYLEFLWANFFRSRLPVIADHGDKGIPDVHPHLSDFIYQTNMQSQVKALLSFLDLAQDTALSTDAQDMSGYNWSRDVMAPLKIEIDERGCVKETPAPSPHHHKKHPHHKHMDQRVEGDGQSLVRADVSIGSESLAGDLKTEECQGMACAAAGKTDE